MINLNVINIHVEVAYAEPNKQFIIPLVVPIGSTIEQVIIRSEIMTTLVGSYPNLKLSNLTVGIFGCLSFLDNKVQDGDRIEIYRPLLIDPKTARRMRATAVVTNKNQDKN